MKVLSLALRTLAPVTRRRARSDLQVPPHVLAVRRCCTAQARPGQGFSEDRVAIAPLQPVEPRGRGQPMIVARLRLAPAGETMFPPRAPFFTWPGEPPGSPGTPPHDHEPGASPMIVAGILGPIEDLLAAVIDWLGPHGAIGLPWAWAIVALTVLVRMALVPLTVKQIHSMQNLQRHAPEMKEIQRKYKGDRTKMNEELMKFYKENSINPASSCLPILFQIPIFISLFFVLRDFEDTTDYVQGDSLEWLGLVNITEPASEGWGVLLLVIYVASQLASTYFMSATMERTQRMIFFALPFLFIPFIINFEAGLVLYWATTNLWTVGQGVVTRRLVPTDEGDAAEEELANAAQGGDHAACDCARGGGRRAAGGARAGHGSADIDSCRASAREAKEKGRPQAMTADGGFVELEASGETIGEAKWQALRELERLHPGLDRDAVTFEVLTEGERGLLGVGTAPARVLARVDSAAIREAPPPVDRRLVRWAIWRAIWWNASRQLLAYRRGSRWRRTTNASVSRCPRPTQACSSAVTAARSTRCSTSCRRSRTGRKARAARRSRSMRAAIASGARRGSRRRRARRPTVRESSGAPVQLEAMSALERRIVHLALEDIAGVETRSEGDDPERCVVVVPTRWVNPWFPHGPPPLRCRLGKPLSSLPAGQAGLRLRQLSGFASDQPRGARSTALRLTIDSRLERWLDALLETPGLTSVTRTRRGPPRARRRQPGSAACSDALRGTDRRRGVRRRLARDPACICACLTGKSRCSRPTRGRHRSWSASPPNFRTFASCAGAPRNRTSTRTAWRWRGLSLRRRWPPSGACRSSGRAAASCSTSGRRADSAAVAAVAAPAWRRRARGGRRRDRHPQGGAHAAGLSAPARYGPQAPARRSRPLPRGQWARAQHGLRAREPEGRRGQDDDSRQPRRLPRRRRRARARRRSRPAGQRNVRASASARTARRATTCWTVRRWSRSRSRRGSGTSISCHPAPSWRAPPSSSRCARTASGFSPRR